MATRVATSRWRASASLTSLSGARDVAELFYGFTSFVVPTTVFEVHLGGAPKSVVWRALEAPVDAGAFEVERVTVTSRDGTKLPLFLAHKKGAPRDGAGPALLTGYGGFDVNMLPSWTASAIPFLESGGTYALAVLRGGGEYGEGWHRAGMLEKKQNVFDDFIAAATWLVDHRITTPARLAISGGSNGGLLVGAALTQRPELFRAVVCGVPLLDMLRYHLFRLAALWVPEYGSPDDPAAARWLAAYSPYQHVRDGVKYPAVFLHTAASDTRVDPMHARKMAARLQAATASGLPHPAPGREPGRPRRRQAAHQGDRPARRPVELLVCAAGNFLRAGGQSEVKKTRVIILFGGRSAEHEISILSARNVLGALDRSRFEPVLVGIDRAGRWHRESERTLAGATGDPRALALDPAAPAVGIEEGLVSGPRPVARRGRRRLPRAARHLRRGRHRPGAAGAGRRRLCRRRGARLGGGDGQGGRQAPAARRRNPGGRLRCRHRLGVRARSRGGRRRRVEARVAAVRQAGERRLVRRRLAGERAGGARTGGARGVGVRPQGADRTGDRRARDRMRRAGE